MSTTSEEIGIGRMACLSAFALVDTSVEGVRDLPAAATLLRARPWQTIERVDEI